MAQMQEEAVVAVGMVVEEVLLPLMLVVVVLAILVQ
jgi:hypothetical protein